MAKDGVLPAPLGELNERYKTPHWPILLTGLLMAISIYSFDVHVIAELPPASSSWSSSCST